jgi:hypothetical protein
MRSASSDKNTKFYYFIVNTKKIWVKGVCIGNRNKNLTTEFFVPLSAYITSNL